ncbi:hypothetical protein FA95DRAFT_1605979 [Auriscalpium vulgare]|uniref:Uncharacterized protein n=1 Tax=Auriscalpium vulgare TaxID=40419 RepID=A0ACB8RTE2_9AGAM|nr:hypothetical protein FA95DRAFT_1605979 [Auriscalpium vulgare]
MALLPLQVFVIALLADVYVYGIYSLLCAFTLLTLFRNIKGNVTNKCLAAATVVMYSVSTISVVLHAVSYLQLMALNPVDDPTGKFVDDYAKNILLDNTTYSIPTIHFVFGDAIVVWRVWVIWQHSWRITVGPFILLVCTAAIVLAQKITTAAMSGEAQTLSSAPDQKRSIPATLYLASLVLTLCTNGVVTGLISYRAWIHYRSSQAVRIRIGRDRALAALLLLVESGALYCTIWITLIVLWPFAASQPVAFYIPADLLPQLTGMYPTVIIVICALRRSYADTVMSAPENLTAMQFATYGRPSSSAATPATVFPEYGGEERTVELEIPHSGCSSRSPMPVYIMSSGDAVLEVAKIA